MSQKINDPVFGVDYKRNIAFYLKAFFKYLICFLLMSNKIFRQRTCDKYEINTFTEVNVTFSDYICHKRSDTFSLPFGTS